MSLYFKSLSDIHLSFPSTRLVLYIFEGWDARFTFPCQLLVKYLAEVIISHWSKEYKGIFIRPVYILNKAQILINENYVVIHNYQLMDK